MKVLTVKPVQKIENLEDFFKSRSSKKTELNNEIQELIIKLKKEAKKHEEILLYSLQLDEIITFLGKQLRENFYSNFVYPETGLFLRQIDFVHREYIGDLGLKYWNNVLILFKFNDERFNGEMSLSSLGFNDEKLRITEQVVGLGFDPSFADKDKYLLVKTLLKEVRSTITKAGGMSN
ncbi:MAG: hypothetical protein KBC11_00330 [Candidatus Pacebacteria bacterium]|nr:hypothetical protein [Candidatus Paceibacterota bacterium]